jgi:type IV secretion system protein VirB9
MLRLQADQAVTQFKSEYPTKLVKFDYLFKDEKPFNIAAIYHDDRFTYIRSDATEKFTVYEVKDSKPNLVNFELKDGTYVLPKVVDRGYLEIGKKHLTFDRKQQ